MSVPGPGEAERPAGVTEDEVTGKTVLPVTEFSYTLDQIAHLLGISIRALPTHVRFIGLNREQPKLKAKSQRDVRMMAHSILPSHLHETPEWRVPESEVTRYLQSLGLVVYERKYQAKESK